MDSFEIIKTEHFCFRLIEEKDYQLYYKLLLDEPEVQWIYREDIGEKLKKDMLDSFMSFYWSPLIERKERETYTIFLKDTTEFIGEISLYYNQYLRQEIGISILNVFRGKGIGSAIIEEWTRWLAYNREIHQVDIHVDKENIASRKCIKKLGADYICDDGDQYYRLDIPVINKDSKLKNEEKEWIEKYM